MVFQRLIEVTTTTIGIQAFFLVFDVVIFGLDRRRTRFRHHIVRKPMHMRGNDGIATVGDVREGAAVDEHEIAAFVQTAQSVLQRTMSEPVIPRSDRDRLSGAVISDQVRSSLSLRSP